MRVVRPRLRGAFAALLVVATILACRKRPVAGEACRNIGTVSCADSAQALACWDFRWHLEACRGPAGCTHAGDEDRCDQTIAAAGDHCWLEGMEACSSDGQMRLRCVGRQFQAISACRGPGGCRTTQASVVCDDSVARPGDPCDKDGAAWVPCTTKAENVPGAACSVDHKEVLLCRAKAFHRVAVCRGPGGCTMDAGQIACDVGVPEEGDACSIPPGEGWKSWRCAKDGKSVLVCSSLGFGHYVRGGRCRGRCSGPPDEAQCDATYAEVGDSCPGNLHACSLDRTQILECHDGRMAVQRGCPSCSTEGRFGNSFSCK
jgi:hypothetical protein